MTWEMAHLYICDAFYVAEKNINGSFINQSFFTFSFLGACALLVTMEDLK